MEQRLSVRLVHSSLMRYGSLLFVFSVLWVGVGCSGTSIDPPAVNCSSASPTSLTTYDQYSSSFLDQITSNPASNGGSEVVWNTRYYLESLLTAYQATKNVKYLQAFEDTGAVVMGLVQTQSFLDVPDPSAPGQTATGPYISRTGWPTYGATLGASVPIPTATGQVALYAQSLYPAYAPGVYNLAITQQPGGTLQISWVQYTGQILQSYAVGSIADLYTIASQPVIYTAGSQSYGRIKATGLGLPVPGTYALNKPLTTIWHSSQTGGILLPFVRFLLIANGVPNLVDPALVSAWRAQVLEIASEYVDEFTPDGKGGYVLRDPFWTPSLWAGLAVESDYVWVESSFRVLLYELTNDPQQLALAKGLLQHQLTQNAPVSSQGWLVLSDDPDFQSWSSKSGGPTGSIWDSFSDLLVPESATDGGFFVETLHLADTYGLDSALGISASLLTAQTNTYSQYLLLPGFAAGSQTRSLYPTEQSTLGDPVVRSPDPFAGSGYLEPETSSPTNWITNWQWMQLNGTTPQGYPIGYFLRAWARSEAAKSSACQVSSAQ
jgi:hypothetical protein